MRSSGLLDYVNYIAFSSRVKPSSPTPPPAPSPVDSVRRFNRFFTHKIGVLQAGLLDSPFSLTEGRVLYELAHRPGVTATELGRDLGLDAGYLSRILARFARERLIARERSRADARQSHLRLTRSGRAQFATLDRRSTAQVTGLIDHLSPGDRDQLVAHLAAVRHLLALPGEKSTPVTLREPRPGELGWIVARHGELYAREYGWTVAFEALVARIVAEYVEHFDARRARCWVAESDGHRLGCIFLVPESATVGKLRLLLVEPSARGRGVGAQLVAACVAFARQAGYRKIVLWTNSVLAAARRIYERAGFRLVASENHHSFGADLVGQTWELDL